MNFAISLGHHRGSVVGSIPHGQPEFSLCPTLVTILTELLTSVKKNSDEMKLSFKKFLGKIDEIQGYLSLI